MQTSDKPDAFCTDYRDASGSVAAHSSDPVSPTIEELKLPVGLIFVNFRRTLRDFWKVTEELLGQSFAS